MADGLRLPHLEYGPTPNLSSSYQLAHELPQDQYGLVDLGAMVAGELSDARPTDEAARNLPGVHQFSFYDDYYNRIHLIPASIDLGSITSLTERVFRVWNAYRTPRTLVQIDALNAEGIGVAGPARPVVFPALQPISYTLQATTSGPPYINSRFTFRFENVPVHPVLPVSGARAELWRLSPNWLRPFNITYEYKTDLWVSRSGREQRRALRNTPRKRFEFQGIASGDSLRWFNRVMTGWHRNSFLVPEYTRMIRTASALPAGSTQVQIDEQPHWMKIGGSVILSSGDHLSSRMIDDIDEDLLVTFTTIDDIDWPAGTKIHPGIAGRMQEELSTQRPTSDAMLVQVVFNSAPTVEDYPEPPEPTAIWRTKEVVLLKPNYARPLSLRHNWPVEPVDFQRGRTKVYVPVNKPSRTWQAEYLHLPLLHAEWLIDVFHRAKGRRGAFYMPTWENDLPPLEPVAEGSFRIRTKGLDVYRLLGGSRVFRNVAVFDINGGVMFNQVVQVFPVSDERGDDTILAMSTPWERSIALDRILRICWMPLWRFGSDALTVSWRTDEVATITPTMTMIEDIT